MRFVLCIVIAALLLYLSLMMKRICGNIFSHKSNIFFQIVKQRN